MIWYVINLLMAADQFVNALFGGYHDETISSRVGKYKRKHGLSWRTTPLYKLIEVITEVVDPNHVIDAIGEDEGE